MASSSSALSAIGRGLTGSLAHSRGSQEWDPSSSSRPERATTSTSTSRVSPYEEEMLRRKAQR